MSRVVWVSEEHVATALMPGRPFKEALAKLREEHLSKVEHFRIDGGRVEYSPSGVEALIAVLQLQKKDAAQAVDAATQPDLPPAGPTTATERSDGRTAPGSATLTRVWLGNPHYMQAKFPAGPLVTIRVRATSTFCAGMVIPAEQLVKVNDLMWDFVGRLPRARGTW